jgi:hypothetical protein
VVVFCSVRANVTSTVPSAVVVGAPSPSQLVTLGDGASAATMDDDNGKH